MDRDGDVRSEAGKCFVDGVVYDLIDEVMEATHTGRADVHAGAAADGLETFEDGDVLRVIAGRPAI
jgi:hypothetical protein